jgi:hypothetical protein
LSNWVAAFSRIERPPPKNLTAIIDSIRRLEPPRRIWQYELIQVYRLAVAYEESSAVTITWVLVLHVSNDTTAVIHPRWHHIVRL